MNTYEEIVRKEQERRVKENRQRMLERGYELKDEDEE
jgi:hypothetical protein